MLFATAIVLLDRTKVGSPASLASLVVIKSTVSPVYKMPIYVRDLSLMKSRCCVSFLF